MSGKASRQFLDTNILVYAHDTSAGVKHERAKTIITELWDSGNGYLSIQVLQEFYVTITRKIKKPLDSKTAARIISNLSLWRIHEPNVEDVLQAIEAHQCHVISFWDAMILQSALQLECEVVFSEDLNAGQVYDGVRVVNPFASSSGR
ncbi:MAG: PIN domain-containing protein [Chloroflexota bacterium]|nr:PIN domain-containing protein [Chloroflexota bacterium]